MPISPPTIILHSRAPFSFDLTLAYFQRRSGELVDRVEESYYRRLLSLNGSPVLAQARSSGDSDRPELIVELLAGDVSHLPLAAAALQRSFGLEDDLEAFLAAVAPDPVLSALTERHRGLR
ncbi:MAG: AlkA N-terminal domain-containing protein, partial [Dehalococcoidia bacterium]